MRTCALILIVAAGLGLRLGQAWQGTDHNLDDSAAYEQIARGLREGLAPGGRAAVGRPRCRSGRGRDRRLLSDHGQ